jgi:threonine dehydratase
MNLVKEIEKASRTIKGVALETPLELNRTLSGRFSAKIYLKREDLQPVRSYKIRGAYNKIVSLDQEERKNGVVCASAGNHAQGVALSASLLGINAWIFMPQNTPRQKIERVQNLGDGRVEISLCGDTFDEACAHARKFCLKRKKIFIPPFEDEKVVAGQGTVGLEIMEQIREPIDYVLIPVGGGGLIAGAGSYFKSKSPKTRVIGVEPEGAPSMTQSLKTGRVVELQKIETFVDGAAVKKVGQLNFKIARKVVDQMLVIPEGKVCLEMISLFQNDGIVTEPAGALSVSALDSIKDKIRGKTVVCIVSGGNNDISRYPEIIERSMMHQGLKFYFIVDFPQRPGALKTFLNDVLGPDDDIVLFEYMKKNNKERGPALIGIELKNGKDIKLLLANMGKSSFSFQLLKRGSPEIRFLV